MNELIESISKLEIEQPDNLLLALIDKDFYEMAMKYINNEIFTIIETDPIHDHYIDNKNSKILLNYLIKNNLGYNLFNSKVEQLIKIYKINIQINVLNMKKYVDYYLENLYIISNS